MVCYRAGDQTEELDLEERRERPKSAFPRILKGFMP